MTSLILQTSGRMLFHTLVVFSVFLLFTGHNHPGGGFIGGLVAGAALVLRHVAEGPGDLERILPVRAPTLLGVGVAFAAAAGVVGMATGEAFLTNTYVQAEVPLLGVVKLTTVLLFDIGVFLIVVGMVYAILETLGAEINA